MSVRHVKTPEGSRYYGIPIGSPITPHIAMRARTSGRSSKGLGVDADILPNNPHTDYSPDLRAKVDARKAEAAKPEIKRGDIVDSVWVSQAPTGMGIEVRNASGSWDSNQVLLRKNPDGTWSDNSNEWSPEVYTEAEVHAMTTNQGREVRANHPETKDEKKAREVRWAKRDVERAAEDKVKLDAARAKNAADVAEVDARVAATKKAEAEAKAQERADIKTALDNGAGKTASVSELKGAPRGTRVTDGTSVFVKATSDQWYDADDKWKSTLYDTDAMNKRLHNRPMTVMEVGNDEVKRGDDADWNWMSAAPDGASVYIRGQSSDQSYSFVKINGLWTDTYDEYNPKTLTDQEMQAELPYSSVKIGSLGGKRK